MPARTEWDRDFARVLHSSSFRRLQGKTQVWGVRESDYFRTRLTHSLEAGQIGGAIAKEYDIPASLVMASCFAHDIGHPPFGHNGAHALNDFAQEVSSGDVVFDDNAQTFRVLVRRESMFSSESGMNLCAATLDGTMKYKNLASKDSDKAGYYEDDKEQFEEVVTATGTGIKRSPLVMFVELADDIAYACHDLDDALRAGFVGIDELRHVRDGFAVGPKFEILKIVINKLESAHSADDEDNEGYRVAAKRVKSYLVDRFVHAAVSKKKEILPMMKDLSYDENRKRNLFLDIVPDLKDELDALQSVTWRYVISDPNVESVRFAGTELLRDYLGRYRPVIENPKKDSPAYLSLPRVVRGRLDRAGSTRGRLRVMLDYVAGMTDRYFMEKAALFHDLSSARAVTVRF
jgi:dGTPase